MQTTFRNGMDFGLADGSMIFLLPKFANTSNIVTLNVNGLGAFKILRYGSQGLAPGDLSPNAYALLIYNAAGDEVGTGESAKHPDTKWYDRKHWRVAACGRRLHLRNHRDHWRYLRNGRSRHAINIPGPGLLWQAYVPSSGTVTVNVCSAVGGTPVASNYNVRVIQ